MTHPGNGSTHAINDLHALPGGVTLGSDFTPLFYGMLPNTERVTLTRQAWKAPARVKLGAGAVKPFLAGEEIAWRVTL